MKNRKHYLRYLVLIVPGMLSLGCQSSSSEVQLTHNPGGHILTNIGAWSPDSQWLAYDTRPEDPVFEGTRIERVNIKTQKVEVLYESENGAKCGVVTYHPIEDKVIFIHGPENPTVDWQYGFDRRRGVIVDIINPGTAINLDARDITPPFTAGALRGGSHVHVFSGDGQWVSFTYQDVVLEKFEKPGPDHDMDLRNIGISVPIKEVTVKKDHPRNHDGSMFSVLVTKTTATPEPGTDEISKAFDETWVGTNGYMKPDGTRQKRAIAFQGHVKDKNEKTYTEVYIVDIPADVTIEGDGPLEGSESRMPLPPKGTMQRRLTHTLNRKYPGLSDTPRQWLRSSPDGSRIAFLMRDNDGINQLWTVSPNGGKLVQVTRNIESVSTAFSWSPNGQYIAYGIGTGIYITNVDSGLTQRVTPTDSEYPVLPLAVVFSPDGKSVAYQRRVPDKESGQGYVQIFVINLRNYR